MQVACIIPAFNEAESIESVIDAIPAGLVSHIIVVNNASTDRTEINARNAGALVVREDRRGYGYACLRGIEAARKYQPEVLVFLDGDFSDHPDEMGLLVTPIANGEADFVLGSRMIGSREPGAMLPQAIAGNKLACWLMNLLWGAEFTDLGPFRAIRMRALDEIGMTDTTFGWTIEMQIKVAKKGLRYLEVPVSYRKRIGVSKITGTISGTLRASAKILYTIAKYAVRS